MFQIETPETNCTERSQNKKIWFTQRAQSPQRSSLQIYFFLWSDRQEAGSAAFAGMQKSCLRGLCAKPF